LAACADVGTGAELARRAVPPGDVPAAVRVLADRYEEIADATMRFLALEDRMEVVAKGLRAARAMHLGWAASAFTPWPPARRAARRASDGWRRSSRRRRSRCGGRGGGGSVSTARPPRRRCWRRSRLYARNGRALEEKDEPTFPAGDLGWRWQRSPGAGPGPQ